VAKASLPVYSSQRSKKASGLTTTWTHSLTASLARSGRNQVTLVPRNTATLTGRGRPMNSHLAAHSNYPADRRARYDETTLRNGSAGLAVRRLNEACLGDADAGIVARSMGGNLGGRWLVGVSPVGVT
jgi:hypothetical protein